MNGTDICPDGDACLMTLLGAYEKWLIGNEVQESSRDEYLRNARRVIDVLPGGVPGSEEELKTRVAALTEEDLYEIKELVGWTAMDGTRKKQNTASTTCNMINQLLKWAKCPHRIRVPRKVKVIRIPLSQDESERLLRAASEHRNPVFAARNRAIVVMFQEGAIRRGSFNVLMEDLRLDEGYFIIRDTKNQDDWKIDVPKIVVEAIMDYLRVRPKGKNAQEDSWLFISTHGTALCDQMAYKVVKQAAARAGLERNIWPHLLRTTKLTSLVRKGVSIYDVKDVACHRNIQSLEPYICMGDEDQHDRIVSASMFQHGQDRRPTVRIEDAGAGIEDLTVRLTEQLVDGRISEATYNRALAAISQTEVVRSD